MRAFNLAFWALPANIAKFNTRNYKHLKVVFPHYDMDTLVSCHQKAMVGLDLDNCVATVHWVAIHLLQGHCIHGKSLSMWSLPAVQDFFVSHRFRFQWGVWSWVQWGVWSWVQWGVWSWVQWGVWSWVQWGYGLGFSGERGLDFVTRRCASVRGRFLVPSVSIRVFPSRRFTHFTIRSWNSTENHQLLTDRKFVTHKNNLREHSVRIAYMFWWAD